MKKFLALIFFLIFILGFCTYQMKFKSHHTYIMENGVPYFKEENDVLKIYPNNIIDDDSVENATIYNSIDKEVKRKK